MPNENSIVMIADALRDMVHTRTEPLMHLYYLGRELMLSKSWLIKLMDNDDLATRLKVISLPLNNNLYIFLFSLSASAAATTL